MFWRALLVSGSLAAMLYTTWQDNHRPSSLNGVRYQQQAIAGTIDTIYQYDRGYPVVNIHGQRITLAVPVGCQRYLRQGDSLVKSANMYQVCTFRRMADYQQRICWGSRQEGDNAAPDGFIRAEKVPLAAPPR